jgi:hypothetical protein
MRRETRPLYAVALTVLVVGVVIGLIFTGISDGAVLVGVAILACLMLILFVLGRRDHLNEHDHHPTPGPRWKNESPVSKHTPRV